MELDRILDKIRALINKAESYEASKDQSLAHEAQACRERADVMMQKLEWKQMYPDFQNYWISGDGHIVNRKNQPISQILGKDGYLRVNLHGKRGKKFRMISRLVCLYYNGPPPSDGIKYQAAHLDTNKLNNNFWNLEWQTNKQNSNNPITRSKNSIAKKQNYFEGKILKHNRRINGTQ